MNRPYAAGDPCPFCLKEGKAGKLYPTRSRKVIEPATLPQSAKAKPESTEFECDTCHRKSKNLARAVNESEIESRASAKSSEKTPRKKKLQLPRAPKETY